MLCKGLHHAAFRCRDARETVDFYTEVLGLKFIHAMGEDHVPSTGKYSPHIHVFLEMEDGSSIAFFECPKDPGNMKDPESPDWIQHFAFAGGESEISKSFAEPCSKEFNQSNEKQVSERCTGDCSDIHVLCICPNRQCCHSVERGCADIHSGVHGPRNRPRPNRAGEGRNHQHSGCDYRLQ